MRRNILGVASLLVLSLAVLFAVTPARPAPQAKTKAAKSGAAMTYGNSDSINEDEMKIYDYFLASDQLEGRYLPSRGYDTAALYVASHLAEWHLKPGGSTTGTNGPLQPYFMPFDLISRQVDATDTKASLVAPAGFGGRGGRGGGGGGGARGGAAGPSPMTTFNFEYGTNFAVAGGGRGGAPVESADVSGALVFVGNGYVINKTNTDPYAGQDVRGKIVVVAGLPPELASMVAAGRGGGRGAAGPNPLGTECTDYMTPEEAAAKNGAVGVITIQGFQQISNVANLFGGFGGGGGRAGRGPQLNATNFSVEKFQAPQACPSVPTISAGLEMTNALFLGERVSAEKVFYAAGENTKLDSFALNANKKFNLHLAVNTEHNHAENVIGILEGSDPVLKNQYVVISAHLDHIGFASPAQAVNGHNINNGADDDGSGSTGLLGIARAYATGPRPKRSMIFLWNAGEERGLWGSQYFNMFPPVDPAKIVADLNIDMIGRTKPSPDFVDPDKSHYLVKHGDVLVVGPKVSSNDLETTLETVNKNYLKLGLNDFYDTTAPDATHDNLGPTANGQRIFYRSDHYNFAKLGIPIAFFTIGLHPDYHRPTDTPEKIDYKEIEIVSRTVSALGWVLANQAGRPQLNATLPPALVDGMKQAKDQGWGKVTPVMPPLPGEPY